MKSKLFKILGVVAIVAMLATSILALPVAALSGVSLAVGSTTISTATPYTVTFTLGQTQAQSLTAFVFTFDPGIAVAGGTTATILTGPGLGTLPITPATAITVASVTGSVTAGYVVTLDTQTLSLGSIGAGAIVQIVFTGVTNPGTAGNYGLTVKTAVETTAQASNQITFVNPPTPVTAGIASVYNSSGVLMSASNSLATALGAVAAGGKITLTAGTYDTPTAALTGTANSCTIQGIDANAANVIIKANAAGWTMSGATVVIDMVTIDGSTGVLTMNNATAGTISNSYLKGGTATFVTFSGAGKNNVTNCTITVKTGGNAITASTATSVTNCPFSIAGTGVGITANANVTVTACTFNGAASTGLVTTGTGILVTAGTGNSIKTNTFSGLSIALNVTGGTVTFDSNTVNACGYGSAPTTDTIVATAGTTGLNVTNNKITNSLDYIINVTGCDTVVNVMDNQFSGNVKNALNTTGTIALNVTHNYWGGAATPADVTTTGAKVTYANALGAAPVGSSIAAATAVDATATAGVNVVLMTGATLVGASNLGANDPVAATLPSTVTVKSYYDVFGLGVTGAIDLKFFGTTANPITSSSTVYFYNVAYGAWSPCATSGTVIANTFANSVEVTMTPTAAGTQYLPSFAQLAGMPWVVVTTNPVAPAAPAQGGLIPATATTGVGISNASFSWTAVAGAATYNFVLSTSSTFAAAGNVFTASPTTNGVVVAKTLGYNTTYYWEVQSVDSTGKLLSAFTTSFFTTALQATPVLTPALGQQGVSLNPTFTWSAVPGAVSYEFALAQEIGAVNKFDILDYSNNTVTNGITAQEAFLYSTTYNWEYRSVDSTGAKSAWTVSFFTTMDKPAATTSTPVETTTPVTPTIIVTAPTVTLSPITVVNTTGTPSSPAIPSYLLWAVIAVGAVLVIAVIVLIVRTRRIP